MSGGTIICDRPDGTATKTTSHPAQATGSVGVVVRPTYAPPMPGKSSAIAMPADASAWAVTTSRSGWDASSRKSSAPR